VADDSYCNVDLAWGRSHSGSDLTLMCERGAVMHQLSTYLIVFVGAGFGGALRHAMNAIVSRLLGSEYPYSTFFVNVGGSCAMGLLAGWFTYKGETSQTWRLFLTTGILGGFTTFSTFSLEAALLWERGEVFNAALYVISSVMFALCGIFGGLKVIALMD
jgi:fluoride exporter